MWVRGAPCHATPYHSRLNTVNTSLCTVHTHTHNISFCETYLMRTEAHALQRIRIFLRTHKAFLCYIPYTPAVPHPRSPSGAHMYFFCARFSSSAYAFIISSILFIIITRVRIWWAFCKMPATILHARSLLICRFFPPPPSLPLSLPHFFCLFYFERHMTAECVRKK